MSITMPTTSLTFDPEEGITVVAPTWDTNDFIQYEFSTTDVSPELCESALQFVESNPDIDEHDYRQFRALRKAVEADFSNPYDLERVSDENGKGFSTVVSYHQEPSDKAWELLDRYFKLNGWKRFEYNFHSTYTWQTTHRDTVTSTSSGVSYLIKIYNVVETEDGLANS